VCEPRALLACYQGDVWWFDSCGAPEQVAADCQTGCANGQCTGCTPSCGGRECGPDPVCGTSCGTCGAGTECNAAGRCEAVCLPDCDGKECGRDGCGGSCGTCPGAETCSEAGRCTCTSHASTGCWQGDVWWFDGCGEAEELSVECLFGCVGDQCTQCEPDCSGRECGPDPLCGQPCGACGAHEQCEVNGTCVCVPDCVGRQCGADGCGSSCGTCEAGFECRPEGTCAPVCVPDCDGRACGDDGCDGTCGTCGAGEVCVAATGVCAPEGCEPSCTGKECGDDGCGSVCGTCPGEGQCNAAGRCELPCQPSCDDKECGDDGCGGLCGECLGGTVCSPQGLCLVRPPDTNGGGRDTAGADVGGEGKLSSGSGGCSAAARGEAPAGLLLLLAFAGLALTTHRRRATRS